MQAGGRHQSQGWFEVPAVRIALTPEHMAEAVVRAAMATGELSLLAYRDEQALRGHVAFRARWVALAALLALHPEVPLATIARPLGCGSAPLRSLGITRGQGWWDEALVYRLFADLAGDDARRDLGPLEGLRLTVAGVLGGLMTTSREGASG